MFKVLSKERPTFRIFRWPFKESLKFTVTALICLILFIIIFPTVSKIEHHEARMNFSLRTGVISGQLIHVFSLYIFVVVMKVRRIWKL